MIVSLCVVAYNEERCLDSLFDEISNQTYDHRSLEIVLIDSCSTDRTLEMMKDFANNHPDFYNVIVLSNPKKIQSAGWNIAIMNASGDIITRVDAHASIPINFIENNVKCIEKGEDIVGGIRPNIIDEHEPWKDLLLMAESSMFGSSIAPYRRIHTKMYVNSVFHATYRREVFEKVGGFNEYLGRTEDNELHYRMRQAGYNFCLEPTIISYQHTRTSLKAMLKQKYGNGYWVGLTIGVCPKCLSIFHFIPLLFIIALIATLILSLLNMPLLFGILAMVYLVVNVVMSIIAVIHHKKHINMILLPILFFLLHISYGIGTVVGVLVMPFWRRNHLYCDSIDLVKQALLKK